TVTLGDYKGIEVTKTPVEVSDEEVDAAILSERESHTTYDDVDRAVQDTDKVNIDYVGTKDGVAFDGGTAQGQELVIGSNQFIDGFESGLIGAKKGDEVTLDLTFPESYGNADLAGQAVVFKVTVNNVQEKNMPELDEAFVQEVSEFKTVDEYKESKKQSLLEQKEGQAQAAVENDILKAVVENCQIETTQEAVDANFNNYLINYTNQAAMYGIDLNTFTSAFYGVDEETFKENYVKNIAKSAVEQRLVFHAIADQEGITVSDEDRDNLATEMGYESKDQMIESAGAYNVDDYLISTKTMKFLVDNAVIK
ncbi:trigger factor, partial [Hungatella effluvii]